MPTINKYGIIRGGLCEKRLKARYHRSVGSWAAWNGIKDSKHVIKNNGWFKIISLPPPRKPETFPGGVFETGYLRMIQDVFSNLFLSGRSFRMHSMKDWIEGIARMEFGVYSETPLSIIISGEKFATSMCPPKPADDAIYEKMYGVPRGIVKS